ncbi:hypothetical protein C6P46_001606 [Rhodotorula mucilaginosa]|uniref:Uncharacterized protein n=1 Tax=Rhodotorula mucilaginosa TaxID=5537 RepID=A0A9P6VUJ1_RHOMI|nr:hypothetical protein C6P46_001606 [Rhodotorula mucilaginosa]TKA53238.1 hypothetical protein B0A53_04094 [Rhodotorula sp. CCFEE 5036]
MSSTTTAAEPSAPGEGTDLSSFLGQPPFSSTSSALLSQLASTLAQPPADPIVKAYSDIVYLNYHSLGLSLSFEPSGGYKPGRGTDLDEVRNEGSNGRLTCSGVDVYNHEDEEEDEGAKKDGPPRKRKGPGAHYAPFPRYPILLPAPGSPNSDSKPTPFPLEPSTIGKTLVSHYGEPSRKGGGESGTSMGVWTEWTPEGIMVEWRSSGLGAWEKGGEAKWSVVSLFPRGKEAGIDPEDGKVGI